jgi:glutamine amidotransferase
MSRSNAIGILDIGMGNLASVYNAIYINGFEPIVVSDGSILDDLTHLILPGVGNFSIAASELDARKLRKPINEYVSSGRPLLGSCLGMQLLVGKSEEGGINYGLDFISGSVELINKNNIRVPHVGWNSFSLIHSHPIFEGIKDARDFYFVHSYHVLCDFEENKIGTVEYGQTIVAAIGRNNIVGVQFHPEKSQLNGLRLLENFCNWDGEC